jgi:hypothetical protein
MNDAQEQEYRRQCQYMGCKELIDPKRRNARFHSDICRQADGRARRKQRPPVLCDECRKALRKKE